GRRGSEVGTVQRRGTAAAEAGATDFERKPRCARRFMDCIAPPPRARVAPGDTPTGLLLNHLSGGHRARGRRQGRPATARPETVPTFQTHPAVGPRGQTGAGATKPSTHWAATSNPSTFPTRSATARHRA